ncbi:MAG: VCBS repeat-containing protein [Bacteroidota bacterium]
MNCTNEKRTEEPDGKLLAEKYCGGCHRPVAPGLLDSITWTEQVLPAMARRLGIEVWSNTGYYVKDSSHAVLSLTNWLKIVSYYKKAAPKKLIPAEKPALLRNDWSIFSLKKPDLDTSTTATTTMIAFNQHDGYIYTSDALGDLIHWNRVLKPAFIQHLPSPAVNVNFVNSGKETNSGIFTCIGSMQPNDFPGGELLRISLNDKNIDNDTMFSSLRRPVQSISEDFNKDGLSDWLICEFGHNKGGLYLFQQIQGGGFTKKTVKEAPGAIQANIVDYDHDGWPDIMVLFAYADEEITLFLNDHKGGFTAKTILQFPAVYGSTSFQLVDFNGDGKMDILYTCGDNADYSKILKPYHGLYIFLNEGNFRYKQSYFYPINGCFKAVARDFDHDGDMDIVSIAFFPDLKNNPSEGFIYFEQDTLLSFIPHGIPVYPYGRWICMEVNDIDNDGDDDILLGNYSNGANYQQDLKNNWYGHLPLLLLQNNSKKK